MQNISISGRLVSMEWPFC